MKIQRIIVGLAAMALCAVPIRAEDRLDVSLPQRAVTFDDNVTPDVIFGSGNANGLFTVDRSNGIELGLRAKIPFSGVIHSNADGTYSYTLAELLAAHASQRWNFDWTVNTDYLDTSGDKIDDYTYLLRIDFDPSLGTDFLDFDPITPTVAVPYFDHSIGDNSTLNGGGTEAVDSSGYAALIAANNVCQQSWRHEFFPIHPTLTYDPTIDGTYDIVLSAYDGVTLVASTSIQVIIGAGGDPVTVYVDDDWNSQVDVDAYNPSLIWQFDAFNNIQDGIDAVAGSTVNVLPGTYGPFVLSSPVNMLGAQAGVDARDRVVGAPSAATESIITAGSGILCELLNGSGGSVIDGFAFVGAGNSIRSNGGPLTDLVIQNNHMEGSSGPAVFLNDSGIDITVHQNAMDGGSMTSGAVLHMDTDNFDGFHFTSNWAVNQTTGFGLFVDGNRNVGSSASRDPLIADNLFKNNQQSVNLGSRAFEEGEISGNRFENNSFDGLLGGPKNTLITENAFINNGRYGLALTSFGNTNPDRGAQGCTVTCSLFTGNGYDQSGAAVLFSSTQAAGTISTNVLNDNNISGNSDGVVYSGAETIDAESNWWGASDGPGPVGPGSGDTVSSANIDYDPFLTSPSTCVPALLILEGVACQQDQDGSGGVQIVIELWMRNLPQDVNGFQAFLAFDTGDLAYEGTLSSYTNSPFPTHIQGITTAEVAAGELRLDGSVALGSGDVTSADALLATLVFTVATECDPKSVEFDLTQAFDSELSLDGVPVATLLIDSPDITPDGTDPTITTCPTVTTVECDGAGNVTELNDWLAEFAATDNCSTPTLDNDFAGLSDLCGETGESGTVTFTATDDCGNSSDCTSTFTIEDTTVPEITCAPDVTIECDESTDPNDLQLAATFPFDSNPTLSATQAPGVWYTDRYAPFGFVSEFFDSDDRLKHSIDATDCSPCRGGSFSSGFYDTQGRKYDFAPGITHMSIELYVPSDWATTERRMAGFWGTAFDSGASLSAFPIIEFTSTTDDSGVPRFRGWNNVSGTWEDMGLPTGFVYDAWYTLDIELVGSSWVYTVGDLQLNSPALGSVEIGNVILQGHNNTAGVTYDIYWDNLQTFAATVANDICDSDPDITYSDSSVGGVCPQEEVITRTWTATDDCGNESMCDQIITVEDTTDPMIGACPADIELNADAGECEAVVTYTPPGATDNCDGSPTVVCTPASGSSFPVGTTGVECVASDACGNTSSCGFDVVVNGVNDVNVEVELVGVSLHTTRCIHFATDTCSNATDVELDFIDHDGDDTNSNGIDDATEGGSNDPSTPVRATATIEVGCGDWTFLCAKDEQHTLYDTTTLTDAGTYYSADALISLRGGDTDNDSDVDINDVTWLLSTFGDLAAPGGCPWDGTTRDADFSNNGAVGSEDYTFLTTNWLTFTTCACTTPLLLDETIGPVVFTPVKTRIEASMLPTEVARRADLNRDGLVDYKDVRLFEMRNGLPSLLSTKMRDVQVAQEVFDDADLAPKP